jgi:hypothetical protein
LAPQAKALSVLRARRGEKRLAAALAIVKNSPLDDDLGVALHRRAVTDLSPHIQAPPIPARDSNSAAERWGTARGNGHHGRRNAGDLPR